ncbi:ABC transporter substrate-binding protein [Tropicimonas sediminicola]|uniref:Peptide/nickel transport system substrate-binding protein n=1 Tax=Tropicimonas sediminicola TaxID=1031541 RepID=A0A239M169_9RHOB|nr:ABC transporter substrate-binding protein [Tropicimonas sediminicola]SNT36557.1 peptide/nickel transport system substrate-binding protein [Tropicimonas sediminicola]
MTIRNLPNGISRRGVLKGASALGAASLILPAGVRPASAEPKKGGILRVGMGHGSTSDSLDPGSWDNAYSQVFATARHNNLTEIAADGSLAPEIAESWEASADAMTWTFTIRQGVTFHSGKDLTPEDVVASINYHRGEESTSAAKPIVENITDIKIDGQNVVISLNGGNADFPFIMSDYHIPIMPAVDGKIDPTSTDGCGPYVVDKFDPGVEALLTRNPNYWKSDRAHFDGIVLLPIVDAAARQNALMSGEVDVIDRVDLNTVHLLQRAPNIKILSVSGTQHYTFIMDSRADPFTDNNVRMAVKHAVNREELVEKILNGYGVVGNDHPIGRSNRFHADDLEQRTYDPDKAKFYLREAGMDSLSLTLSASEAAFGGAVDAAVLISESAAAAGITVEVSREPADGYWSNVWMQKPFVASYWGGRPTEDWMFSTAYASGAPWNESYWEHEGFNKLLVEARSELDEAKRREMYVEMQRLVRDEGSTVIPMFANYVMAHTDAVATPEQIGANWTMDGFRAIERWWFA